MTSTEGDCLKDKDEWNQNAFFWEMRFFFKYSLRVKQTYSQLNTHEFKEAKVSLVSSLISSGNPATTSHACFIALYSDFYFLP